MPELGEVLQGTSDEHQPLRLSQLQDVNLLQLGHILPLRLQADCHDVFQLVKTGIDPGPPLSLQQGLCDFLILMFNHNLSMGYLTSSPLSQITEELILVQRCKYQQDFQCL